MADDSAGVDAGLDTDVDAGADADAASAADGDASDRCDRGCGSAAPGTSCLPSAHRHYKSTDLQSACTDDPTWLPLSAPAALICD